jgi:hypothetical protein
MPWFGVVAYLAEHGLGRRDAAADHPVRKRVAMAKVSDWLKPNASVQRPSERDAPQDHGPASIDVSPRRPHGQ